MKITTKRTIDKCPYTSLIPKAPDEVNRATFFVISIIEKGEGEIVFYDRNGKKHSEVHMNESSCVVIPPFVPTIHKNFIPGCNDFLQRNIHVDEATFKECCDLISPDLYDHFLFSTNYEAIKLSSPTMMYVAECCTIISGEDSKYFENIHKSVVCTILSSYLSDNLKNNAFPIWIRTLIRNLKNLDFLLLPIEDMVKTTNYSHGYVNREIKKYLGMPLKQYVIKKKLDIASSMLVTSNLSMQEIVDRLDFSNISNFINLFKIYYMTTPAKYRKVNSATITLDDNQEWGESIYLEK